MEKITRYCDICKKETIREKRDVQVIFKTEQTEGTPYTPYLDNVKIDLCDNCLEYLLKGNYIFAYGAMGGN